MTKAPSKMRRHNGFTTVEILIMMTILVIVTAFGLIGITNARASVRLSGAAREYASYIEKARMHSIRNHADDEAKRANVAINESKTSYNVTMDLDSDGTMDTKTIQLPERRQLRNGRNDRVRLARPHVEYRRRNYKQ